VTRIIQRPQIELVAKGTEEELIKLIESSKGVLIIRDVGEFNSYNYLLVADKWLLFIASEVDDQRWKPRANRY
jgi:hypothetical protein